MAGVAVATTFPFVVACVHLQPEGAGRTGVGRHRQRGQGAGRGIILGLIEACRFFHLRQLDQCGRLRLRSRNPDVQAEGLFGQPTRERNDDVEESMDCHRRRLVVALALLRTVPGAVDSYYFSFLFFVFLYAIMAQGWNLVAGYAGR